MPTFKYLVVNQDKKELSGTVEAPNDITARKELNNLGFSILNLEETTGPIETASLLPKFFFEAIDKNSRLISGTIPAATEELAWNILKHEYALTVTAVWKENASETEIALARKVGAEHLKAELSAEIPTGKNLSPDEEKQEQILRTRIELVLKEVNELLAKFDKVIPADQKNEIYRRIDKLLRIKNSTNLDYILETAEELLKFIQSQEKTLKEEGHREKQLELILDTRMMLDQLNRSTNKKTLRSDILEKIQKLENSKSPKFLKPFLELIKKWLVVPPEILELREKISTYNRQLLEFIKLYFKEPAKEYKEKVKNTLKTIWNTRKKAKSELKQLKKQLKENAKKTEPLEPSKKNVAFSFLEELNALTGWLLAFYLIYYFLGLYLTSKNFGLATIPSGFIIYQSHIFKYALVILFLLHGTLALKINFFRKNIIADIILPLLFVFGTILTVFNY